MLSNKASILICSLNREDSLKRLLGSLDSQTRKDFEILVCRQEGALAELKAAELKKANGEIIIFMDDDIECHNDWFENMMRWFDKPYVVGVSGPTYVPTQYRANRDVFREGLFKRFYNWFFLEGRTYEPGQITSCGVNTFGASYRGSHTSRMRFVDFLEPSAFGIRRWAIDAVGGIDTGYVGIGEWYDTDLCYRVRKYGQLVFAPDVKVRHYPTQDTTTDKRHDTQTRYNNYCRWADKHIRKTFKHYLYRLFLKLYYWRLP